MSCINVINEAGEKDPRFQTLVSLHNGDEQKALRDYVKSYVLGKSKLQFSVVTDSYTHVGDFVNGSFSITDKFTDIDASHIEFSKENHYDEKVVEGVRKFVFYKANGAQEIIDPSELDSKIAEKINDKKTLDASLIEKLRKLFDLNVPGKDFTGEIQKQFPRVNPGVVFGLLSGLKKTNISDYKDLSGKPWFLASLAEEKVMIHEELVDGKKHYEIILPSLDYATKEFNGSGMNSFMTDIFGNTKAAQQKGFTIKNNLAGRKQLIGSMIAMAIKTAEPDASIKGLRFASFADRGETFNLDLTEGIENLKALSGSPETKNIIPGDLASLIQESSAYDHTSYGASYMDQLYRDELAKKKIDGEFVDHSMIRNYEEKNIDHLIKNIERRILYIVRNFDQPGPNGIKPFEDPSHYIGKEMYSLAKAKEELIQSNGIDKRQYNKGAVLSDIGSWRRSLGEIQNAEMNMVYNEFNSIAMGYKQRFDDFLKDKAPLFKEYVDAYEKDKGVSVKSKALNYTEKFYENLYDKIEVKTFENGKVSDKKVKVNIQKFKDPENMSNDLKDYERKFIRGVLAFHKKSIVRFIDKKIENREISSELYKDGEAWYKANYKNQELLLPVMRKQSGNFLAEGNIKESVKATLNEGSQLLELSPRDLIEERSYRPEGSASMQLGGKLGSKNRWQALGLQEINGEFVLVNPALNNKAMGDVEQVMHSSVFQNFKMEFEPQITATYAAAKIILIKESMLTGIKRTNELKHLESMFNNMLYNERESIVQGTKNPEKALDAMRRFTSTATLALNWKSNALALSGNMFSLISNAISNRFGKEYFNGKDFYNAFVWSGQNAKMFGAIVDEFMFHDKTESALVFSGKYKAGEKGLVKNHHLMLLNTLGDRYTRGLVLIAQLQHEGLLKNFKFDKNGKLAYDWSMDKRDPKIKAHIQAKNLKQEKRDLPYDDVQMNTLNSITAKMFGAYTDEDRTRIRNNGIAQWMGQFKGYLVARSNELVQSGFDNTNISWYSTDPNGDVKLSTFYQEGMANTLFHFINEATRLGNSPAQAWKNMRPEQRRNMQKLIVDSIMFGSLMLIYGGVVAAFDDEDKTMTAAERRSFKSAHQYLKYAFLDIVGVYNVNDYMDAMTPASIPVLQRYANALYDFAVLDFDKGFDKAVMKTGAGKSVTDVISVFN